MAKSILHNAEKRKAIFLFSNSALLRLISQVKSHESPDTSNCLEIKTHVPSCWQTKLLIDDEIWDMQNNNIDNPKKNKITGARKDKESLFIQLEK